MTNIENILFVFENCEKFTIPGKYVGDFCLDDISTTIERVAINCVKKMDRCGTVIIEIHKDANVLYYPFGIEKDATLKFERFKGNDITHIEVSLYDDCDYSHKKYEYVINWTGDSDYSNASQKTYISSSGHMYIVIDEDETIDSIFGEYTINNKKRMNAHFDMLGIK